MKANLRAVEVGEVAGFSPTSTDREVVSPCFELRWSFLAKLMIQPVMWLAIVEAFFVTILCWLITRLMPASHPWRRDPRKWPSSVLLYMAGTGCRYVKYHAMEWKALEYLYVWSEHTRRLRGVDWLFSNLWNQLENVRATRNRFRNLRAELLEEVRALLRRGEDVRIVSLAAGSARAPIEAMAFLLRRDPTLLARLHLLLVDADPEAFRFARDLAAALAPGLERQIEMMVSTISGDKEKLNPLLRCLRSFDPNIIEMVGFTDYMLSGKAIVVFRAIREVMPSGACFLTTNVPPNGERIFLERVVTWKMRNRTEQQVHALFQAAGFTTVRTVWEPTGIQPIYVARKE